MPPGCQTRRAIGSGKPLWKLPHRWKKAIRYAAFYHRCLEKWENDFSTATTAATAAQFKNRTSHTFWRRPGFLYSISFAVGGRFRVEIYIDLGEREQNLAALESLRADTAVLEADLGERVEWEPL